jgi:hypothetical protein
MVLRGAAGATGGYAGDARFRGCGASDVTYGASVWVGVRSLVMLRVVWGGAVW